VSSNKLYHSLAITVLIYGIQILPAIAQTGPGNLGGVYNVAYTCTADIYRGKVNLRTGAGQNYRLIRQLPNAISVQVLDRATGRDGYIWHKVRYENSVGWVRGDFLCAGRGD
jgi:Bacterial SH3 domain